MRGRHLSGAPTVWGVALATAAAGTTPSHLRAWDADSTPVPGERATQARLARRFPCPDAVPAAWRRGGVAQTSGWRCSLLVAADDALRRARRRADLRGFRAEDVQCARVVPARLLVLGHGRTEARRAGYWSVEFYERHGAGARAVVDMRTGQLVVEPLPNEFGAPFDRLCPSAPRE